jgi:DNA-binding MarR family transcriptional regulator/GNAT superfamily N-acetyltransferase
MSTMSGVASDDRIAAVRAFNRFYTARIGALQEGFLRTPHTLPEARVLFELGQREVTEVAELRRALELDAGYLSRLLARLYAQGLVARERSSEDRRRQRIRLTAEGRDAYELLDRRSAEDIGALLDALGEDDGRRLVGAMDVVRTLVDPVAPRGDAYVLRPPGPGDLGWIVQRHGAVYAAEHGWDVGFEALVARILADFADDHDPAREAAWIAEVDGAPAGCVLCVAQDAATARLRLLFVDPAARGRGIGGRLVEECVRFARRAGYAELVLWTNDVLHGARRLYERAGFTLQEQKAHRSFGHDLVGQDWSLRLR